MTKHIDVPGLIDGAPLGGFQVLTIALCGLAILLDGFDIQVIGFVAPAIVQEWNIDKAALGPVFAAGLAGLLVGSFVLSVAADKWGRRPVLILSTLLFGICTLLTTQVTSVQGLAAARFCTGFGLGAILSNAMALAGEYSPQRIRVAVLMSVGVCFGVGAILAGVASSVMLARWGWQSVFIVGAIVPLACALVMAVHLPESVQFLVLRGRLDAARDWLRRIDPAAATGDVALKVREPAPDKTSVLELFSRERARMTSMLWGVNLLNLLTLYFLSNWIPTVVRAAGRPLADAVMAGTVLQAGGTVGALLLGMVIDKAGFRRVLLPCFAVATFAIVAVGQIDIGSALLLAAIFVTGFCVIGGQGAVNALATSYYPTALRSTGSGWALGIGRLGSILGPLLGGEFMKMGLATSQIFLVLALPSLVSTMLVWAMVPRRKDESSTTPGLESPLAR